MADGGMETLKRLLTTLPQELYDEIYSLTFKPLLEDYTITETWRPSHLLRVDYASRQRFRASYFHSTATITFRSVRIRSFGKPIIDWLRRRNPANLAVSQSLIVVVEGPFYDSGEYVGVECLCMAKHGLIMFCKQAFEMGHPAREMVKNIRFEFEDMQLWSMLVSAKWSKQESADQAWIEHMQEIGRGTCRLM